MSKLLSWIVSFVIFLLLAIAFIHPSAELSLDLGEHIRFGELIVTQHLLPTTNIFSYTYPTAQFIHQEFIPDSVFYLLFHAFGITSLIIFTTIVVCISFGLLFFYAYKRVSFISLALTSLLYIRIIFERTYVRPEIFSYLFISLFVVLLLTYRKHFTRWIYLLIPLQFMWVNSHIYFIFGIFLIGVVFLEMLREKKNAYETKILGLVLLASICVCLINPNGLAGALYPFTVFRNYGFSVQENNSIFTIEALNPGRIIYSILFFKITVVSLFLLLCIFVKNTSIAFWCISLVSIVLATTSIRNFPVFIFATFVPFILLLDRFLKKAYDNIKGSVYEYKSALLIGSHIVILGIFLWYIFLVMSVQQVGLGASDAAKPAVDFFTQHNIRGPIFNNYGIGSYLVFRLYPKEKVFVDARPEAYPASFFADIYTPMQTNHKLFEKIANQYKINAIVFDYPSEQTAASRMLLQALAADSQWKMIYLDDTVVVFVKNNKQNETLIKKYQITENTFQSAKFNNDEASLENLAYFFTTVGWDTQTTEIYKEILSIDPNNCAALAYEIKSLSEKNDSGASILLLRYQALCVK